VRTDPTPEPGDYDEVPFSNGTEWETWSANVCGAGDGCIHDSTYGQADEEMPAEVNCPLITLAMIGVWPHEWPRHAVDWQIGDKSGTYYRPGVCAEFCDHIPTPKPDPVVAIDLFGTYAQEPAS
jgi:hypothetical protein